MPTTIQNRGPMYTTITGPNGFYSQTLSVHTQSTEVTVKQSTARRSKPVDLFGQGTALSHSRSLWDRGYATYQSGQNLTTIPVDERISGEGSGAPFENLNQQIGSAIRAKIKSQNLNLAQSVAEYRQASSMFAGLARDIISTFRSLRNGRAFADFTRMLQAPRDQKERAIANKWLQYQYGWKPLMSDIYGATDLLAVRIKTGIPIYVSLNRSAAGEKKEFYAPGSDFRRSWTFDQTAKGRARYVIRDASMKTLAQTGISNPLLLAWELIPYSFVVDWMFPVGNFLSSLDALNGTESLAWFFSERRHAVCTYGFKNGTSTGEYWAYIRTAPSSSLPLPSLGYKPSSSLTAVANGLALLSQIRTGR